jgi:hypothetical protein
VDRRGHRARRLADRLRREGRKRRTLVLLVTLRALGVLSAAAL